MRLQTSIKKRKYPKKIIRKASEIRWKKIL